MTDFCKITVTHFDHDKASTRLPAQNGKNRGKCHCKMLGRKTSRIHDTRKDLSKKSPFNTSLTGRQVIGMVKKIGK